MVVNDVHDDVDAGLGVGRDDFLEFLDSGVAVMGIGRINAFEAVVIQGIVAPVEFPRNLVVGLVEDWLELNGVHPEVFDVVEARRRRFPAFFVLGPLFF